MLTRVWFSVGLILVVMGADGVCLAKFPEHLSLVSFTTGVLALTALRTFEVVNRCHELGMSLSLSGIVSLTFGSLASATAILSGSLVIAYFAYWLGGDYSVWRCPPNMPPGLAVVCGAFGGYCACNVLRPIFWPYLYPTKSEGLAAESTEYPVK